MGRSDELDCIYKCDSEICQMKIFSLSVHLLIINMTNINYERSTCSIQRCLVEVLL